MKYNKIYKIKCFRRKYLKTSKNRGCGNISPQLKKNIRIRIRKGKLHINIVYIIFNITGEGLYILYIIIISITIIKCTVGSPPAMTANLHHSSTKLSPSTVFKEISTTRGRPGAGRWPDIHRLVSDRT